MRPIIILIFCVCCVSVAYSQVIPINEQYSWCSQFSNEESDIHILIHLRFYSETQCEVGIIVYNESFNSQAEHATYSVSDKILTIDFVDKYPKIEHIFKSHNEIEIISINEEKLVLKIGKDVIPFGRGFNKRIVNKF